MDTGLVLKTKRLSVRVLQPDDAQVFSEYLAQNQSFHRAWDQEYGVEFFLPGFWQSEFNENQFLYDQKVAVRLGLFKQRQLIGMCHIGQLLNAPVFQAQIGYHIDQAHVRQGLMFEALRAVLVWAFPYFGLKRMIAIVLPENQPSLSLLKKLNFVEEGRLRQYLAIQGQRRDHLLYSLLDSEAGGLQ